MPEQKDFESLEASELWCPRCKCAQKVRSRLLLVLPTGNKHEYRCVVCGTSVGTKEESDASAFSLLAADGRALPPARR